jgi:hypothetical protein
MRLKVRAGLELAAAALFALRERFVLTLSGVLFIFYMCLSVAFLCLRPALSLCSSLAVILLVWNSLQMVPRS